MKRSEKQKNLMRSAIAPTIVATIIFFITYFFFGMENTMIGPFATLSFLRYRNMCNHYECLIRNFIVYMIMAVFSLRERSQENKNTMAKLASRASKRFPSAEKVCTGAIWKKIRAMPAGK